MITIFCIGVILINNWGDTKNLIWMILGHLHYKALAQSVNGHTKFVSLLWNSITYNKFQFLFIVYSKENSLSVVEWWFFLPSSMPRSLIPSAVPAWFLGQVNRRYRYTRLLALRCQCIRRTVEILTHIHTCMIAYSEQVTAYINLFVLLTTNSLYLCEKKYMCVLFILPCINISLSEKPSV